MDFQAQAAELDNHLETLMGRTAGSMWEQSMEGFAIDDLSLTSDAVRVPSTQEVLVRIRRACETRHIPAKRDHSGEMEC